jgi:hypothetical protein
VPPSQLDLSYFNVVKCSTEPRHHTFIESTIVLVTVHVNQVELPKDQSGTLPEILL